MSKLFTEAECLSIVESASGRPFCSPPAVKTESVQGLAALAGSGQARAIPQVAALFVRSDSHYKTLGLDCYDFKRNALTWPGGSPGVYHPPCRAWGRYKTWAKPRHDEKDLARWAMSSVRRFGGVLEHPASSELWKEFHCSTYGLRDEFGGVLFPVMQSWFGHRAPKETALYLVGSPIPDLSHVFTAELASGRIENMGRAERERTPAPFAEFLACLAAVCV